VWRVIETFVPEGAAATAEAALWYWLWKDRAGAIAPIDRSEAEAGIVDPRQRGVARSTEEARAASIAKRVCS